jgi:hypothetical protein
MFALQLRSEKRRFAFRKKNGETGSQKAFMPSEDKAYFGKILWQHEFFRRAIQLQYLY